MRILLVEDDDRIADFLLRALKSEGHSCVRSSDGKEALQLGRTADFDLILLDLMLPGISGLNICQELRIRKISTPIVILTAMDDVEDIVTGLKMGADDYITKPFVIDELLARIEAIGRRGPIKMESDSQLIAGDIVLDRKAILVTVSGAPVTLTSKEFAVLELLMSHPGQLFSRERILSNVWGMDTDPLTNVVDVYVGKLRRKLFGDGQSSPIETIRGMGYKLKTS